MRNGRGYGSKTAALPGFILKPGAWAVVRFSNTNTAAGATLNIGGTGAKPIQYHGKVLTAGTPGAGRAYAFIYTGSAYELVGDVLTLAEGCHSTPRGISTLIFPLFRMTRCGPSCSP